MYIHRHQFFVDYANSNGANCFCEVWLNFIILFQSKILPPNSGENKKGLCRILVLSQFGISISCNQVGISCQKNEGARHILPPSVSDARRAVPSGHLKIDIYIYTYFTPVKLTTSLNITYCHILSKLIPSVPPAHFPTFFTFYIYCRLLK